MAPFVFFFVLIHLGNAKLYEPCELALKLHSTALARGWNHILPEIPMLVCAAGFQQFSTDFSLYNYRGVFGLTEEDSSPNASYELDDVSDDLDKFAHNVLRLGAVDGHPNYDFYKKLCDSSKVRVLSCHLNPIVPNYEVNLPVDPHLLNALRGSRHRGDVKRDEILVLTAPSVPSSGNGDTFDHTMTIGKAFLVYFTFWLTGSSVFIIGTIFFVYIRALCVNILANM